MFAKSKMTFQASRPRLFSTIVILMIFREKKMICVKQVTILPHLTKATKSAKLANSNYVFFLNLETATLGNE
jgi:hypothetical protein